MTDFVKGISFVLLFAPLSHYVSFRTLVFTSILAVGFRFLIHRKSQRDWRVKHGGFVAPGFERVAEVFRESVRSKEEKGAAFAVYYKGKVVVDLWGGYADYEALRYRKSDSTSLAYSTTKAIAAICMAHLSDRGLIDYDKPVVKYWPEFGQNNKEDITVKTLLCHRAGLIAIREKYKLSLARDDPQELGRLLAKQEPFWTPGTCQGYHRVTLGLYADQLVRRVDPKGRSLSKYFQDEIAEPFDIDFMVGEQKEQFHRACRQVAIDFGWMYYLTTTIPVTLKVIGSIIYALYKYKKIYIHNFIGNPTDYHPRKLNNPDYIEIDCCSTYGIGTARGLAKLMGILANGGTHNTQVLLTSKFIEYLNTPLSDDYDHVLMSKLVYGPGTMLQSVNYDGQKPHHAFGHWGIGGQMAFCDRDQEIGWAYLTNYCNYLHGLVVDPRYARLEKAMYECLKELDKNM